MLRLALVEGCPRTASQYAQAAARVRGVRFVAVVHSDKETRHEAARMLGVTLATASLDDLLRSEAAEFDAVLLRGPVTQRPAWACRAAEAGKHVCITSPASVAERELEELAEICQRAGVTLMLGSRRRFQPSLAAVKRAIDTGQLGLPVLLRCHHWQSRETGRPEDWERSTRRSPGKIWSEVVNHLELAVWLFGRPPTEVFAFGQERADHWPDTVQLHLGFSEGGMALISLAFGLPAGDGYDVVTVIGTTGAAYADDHPQRQLVFRGGAPRAVLRNDDILTRTAHLRAFVQAVAQGENLSAGLAEARLGLRLAEVAWTSLVDHQPIAVTGGDQDVHR